MDVVLVNVMGLALIWLIVWYFWLSSTAGTAAAVTTTGTQEALVVVSGGYSPDTIRVEAGRPVRLIFERREADPCSERVIFDSLGVTADLPEGEAVPVDFTPTEPGDHEFTCQMGMLRGKVIVT
ncbi:MAG: cupredoxin domain-containing protein [Gammaproteobacteria bacterium]|nr:cupredoxin domain-containing protein [Gammaproteobacteria bacterium]